jgi:ComF family protein
VAQSAFLYHESGPLRSVLLRLKHGADLTVVHELADHLLGPARAVATALQSPRLCPVPLHWFRQMRRGYNQAELLARALCGPLSLPLVRPLYRPRATLPQKGSRPERQAAMRTAFRVRDPGSVAGLDFLLVDDVLTTGATAGACAQALLDAGARAVGVVTLARVPPRHSRL